MTLHKKAMVCVCVLKGIRQLPYTELEDGTVNR